MGCEEEVMDASVFPRVVEILDITRSLVETEPGDEHEEGYSPYLNAIIVATVGFALFFQALFRQLERLVEGKRHAKEVLQSMFKELAILGLVAFVLFALEFEDRIKIDEETVLMFDIIHMSIFIITVLYTIFTGVLLYLSTKISRKWKSLEDVDIHIYNNFKETYYAVNCALGIGKDEILTRSKMYRLALCHPILYRKRRKLVRHLAYQEVRSNFIDENDLPDNFRFVIYLEKCKQSIVLKLAEIGETAWVCLAVFISVVMYYQAVFNTHNLNIFAIVLFFTILPVLLVLIVRNKVVAVFEEMFYDEVHFMQEFKDVKQLQNLFWMGMPHFLTIILQFSQFMLCVAIALSFVLLSSLTHVQNIAVWLVVLVCTIIYTILLPQIIYDFSMVTHVGNLVNKRLLSSALRKQQRDFQKTNMLPTLRQAMVLAQVRGNEQPKTMKERILSLISSNFFCRVINYCILSAWRSINSDSNAHMDALSYLDFIVILRLARWTRRVFLMELKKHMDTNKAGEYLGEVQVLLGEQADPRSLGGILDLPTHEIGTIEAQQPTLIRQEKTLIRTEILPTEYASDEENEENDTFEMTDDQKRQPEKIAQLPPPSMATSENVGQPLSHAQTELERKHSLLQNVFSRKLARRPDIPLAMSSSDFDRSQEPEKLDGSSVVSNLSNSTKPSELIINAWTRTCNLHPDVTAIHGGLSVPILRLMLNLPQEKDRRSSSYLNSSVHSKSSYTSGGPPVQRRQLASTNSIRLSRLLQPGTDRLGLTSSTTTHKNRARDRSMSITMGVGSAYMRQPNLHTRHPISLIPCESAESTDNDERSEKNLDGSNQV